MNNWKSKTLNEVCQFSNGLWKGEKPPFVRVGVIRNTNFTKEGTLDASDIAYLDVEAKKLEKRQLQFGDIILEKSGGGPKQPVGRVVLFDKTEGSFSFSNFTAALRVINPHELDSRFLHKYLHWTYLSGVTVRMQSYSTGIRNLDTDAYKSIKIPIPPLTEQQRLVKLLEEANDLRTSRDRSDRRTAALIPALFDEMFGNPVTNPKGWPLCPVSSFVEELHGGRSVNPAGADEAGGRYRVLKISAVTWGEFRPEESKPVSAGYEPPESHFVRAGDLLFSRANTTELVAATSYVFATPPNLLLPDKLWRFVWKQPMGVEPLFVWWLLQAHSVRRELGQRATGTGGSMKNISKPKVMSLEVPLPPLPLQKEFAQRANEIREIETTQAASRTHLDALFQSMLHRAFNGEL